MRRREDKRKAEELVKAGLERGQGAAAGGRTVRRGREGRGGAGGGGIIGSCTPSVFDIQPLN